MNYKNLLFLSLFSIIIFTVDQKTGMTSELNKEVAELTNIKRIHREVPYQRRQFNFHKLPNNAHLRYEVWDKSSDYIGEPKDDILILGGRGTFIEKFTHQAIDLSRQGHRVWTFDWRGQGLSYDAGAAGHIDSYDLFINDLTHFINKHLDGKEFYVLAQSMGAHVVLRYMHENPDRIKGAVLTAPMLDIKTEGWPWYAAYGLAKLVASCGWGKLYAPGQATKDPTTVTFHNNVLTSDKRQYESYIELIDSHPHLKVGGVTFGWLAATFQSIKTLLAPEYLGVINTPILAFYAPSDEVVENKWIPFLEKSVPHIKVVQAPDYAKHQLLAETTEVQTKIWDGFHQFVAQVNAGTFNMSTRDVAVSSVPTFTGDELQEDEKVTAV